MCGGRKKHREAVAIPRWSLLWCIAKVFSGCNAAVPPAPLVVAHPPALPVFCLSSVQVLLLAGPDKGKTGYMIGMEGGSMAATKAIIKLETSSALGMREIKVRKRGRCSK